MMVLLTACLFFEILVHVPNCISESARPKTVFGHLKAKIKGVLAASRDEVNLKTART